MSEEVIVPKLTGADKRARLARLLAQGASRPIRAQVRPETGGRQPMAAATQPRRTTFPLSFAQQRIWFFDQLTPGTSTYNIHFGLCLSGSLQVDRLERCLSSIAARHETLRSRFAAAADGPVQIVEPPALVPLRVVDLSSLAPVEREAECLRQAEIEANIPFDLARGRLFRAGLIRLGDDRQMLLVTMHHIVSDAASAAVVMRELKALYEATDASLPELALQYGDFAAWQRQQADAGAAFEAQVAYWRGRLAGDLPVLSLPADFPRPPVQSFRGGTHVRLLTPALVAELKALSRRHGATLFMTMLAAFELLVGRLAGQEDVIVGTPVSGRSLPEAEALIGCFINTLPVRVSLSGQPAFVQLLARVREAALGAYANQDVPFDRLVEAINPPRDRGRTPVFQVLFNMLGADAAWRTRLGNLVGEPAPPLEEPAKFDLTVYVGETSETLYLRAVYNADLFQARRIEEYLAQYVGLLQQIAADPQQSIEAYSLVTPAAREHLPQPTAPLPVRWAGSVLDRFTAHVAAEPGRLAVQYGTAEWSYRDLDQRSEAVAAHLTARGIGRDAVVALYASRTPALVAALLGIWKAGAAFLILDSRYPAARLAAQIDAARPAAILSAGAEVPPAVAGNSASSPRLLSFAVDALAAGGAPSPRPAADPDALAYLAFTSGSTGAPKGIAGTQRPVSHFLQWHADTFGLGPTDRFSVLSGLSHDPVLRDIFAPLWVGGSMHLPEERDLDSGKALRAWLRRERVTVMHLTPAMADLIGQGFDAASEDPCAVRLACFGGDALSPTHVGYVRASAPAVRCVNFYGTTETPQAMAFFEPSGAGALAAGTTAWPIGVGIEAVQLLVLNRVDRLAGIGELGEICVRTPYLCRGYLATDEAQAFSLNPYTGRSDDRLYRTRDLGRYRPDGLVDLCGRRDGQLKLRGFRIEPGDVEQALLQHPDVRQAVVALDVSAAGEAVLVAHVVAASGVVDAGALRTFLGSRLPAHMVPGAFVALDAVTLTPNGKVDRTRLPAAGERVDSVAALVPPATPIEEGLVEIWSELLKITEMGVTDNFFDLGGHSLLGTRLVSRIRAEFGVEIPLRAVFDSPTVGRLAVLVTQALLDDEQQDLAALSDSTGQLVARAWNTDE